MPQSLLYASFRVQIRVNVSASSTIISSSAVEKTARYGLAVGDFFNIHTVIAVAKVEDRVSAAVRHTKRLSAAIRI
nr:hypothetical protein [Pseudoramibacter sp. HA2172]